LHAGNNPERANAAQAPAPLGANLRFERTRLPKPARVVIERLTKKTEPKGAGQETSGPLLSVRIRPAKASAKNALDPDG
jgi:hypothetical protein